MAKSDDISLLPVYFIAGDDALKREAVLRRLHMRLEKLGDLAFNHDEISGESASAEQIVSACQTIPFACEKRLVTLNDADKLKKRDTDGLIAYIEDPSETTVLALISQKNDKTSRLYKAVSKIDPKAVIDCARPKKSALPQMVVNMAKVHGVNLTDRAAKKIIELIGEDTVAIDNQLEKISLAADISAPIDIKDVMVHVAQLAEAKPWQFVDAFASRDLRGCIRFLSLMPSVSPHALLSMCTTRLRELICAKSLERRGLLSVGNLSKQLGAPEWKVKSIASASSRFTSSELRSSLINAAEAERKMKSGSDADTVFLEWIIAVIGK